MKIALLGTGFGQAHAAVYATRADVDVVVFGRTPEKLTKVREAFGFETTLDLDTLIADPSVDLVDICLPTALHADTAVRAMQAGKDVLIELPLATTMDDAGRIVAAQQATGRRAFVDMYSRFSPAYQRLRRAVAEQQYGQLRVLEIETRSALLWEGYDLTLETLVLDMMHGDLDLITGLLGRPDELHVAGIDGVGGRGSAAEVILGYPSTVVRCTSSSLMPRHYEVRGGYRATFAKAVLEYEMSAGFTGHGAAALTEFTADAASCLDVPSIIPYAAMIDHVLGCLNGQADNLIEPATALDALAVTLEVQHRLTSKRG